MLHSASIGWRVQYTSWWHGWAMRPLARWT